MKRSSDQIQLRKLYSRILNLLLPMTSAVMTWKGLMLMTNCRIPIIVLVSGGMADLNRGDLFFTSNFSDDPIHVGETMVFQVEGRGIPIIHRVIKLHKKVNGELKLLTKGDENPVDDRGLYPPGQEWLRRENIIGKVQGIFCCCAWETPY
ncbi:SEC11C [Branchiostoma lanceolatum]|uniref:Signal peptidase complex catalytic subunit SEC11 n=1 Tax=Branchiostoma lanceolatum TaxID=7740 RepID=A0A8J9ZDW1_BRALA|nr:SEC11C [Branchiostoma lanceolatum]